MRRFRDAPKRSVNLSLNSAVLDMARELGLNISQTVDQLLAAEVEHQYWARWQVDNAEAIAAYNERIAREGLFSDRHRSFMRSGKQRDAA
jgi:antitoxin CcdA